MEAIRDGPYNALKEQVVGVCFVLRVHRKLM